MSGSDNKRVAKNTAFLYFRMLFLTAISLYTVRITLNVLGEVDYGIYNVVGSVVASLGFMNGTLTSASQRFLAYHLGRKDYIAYNKTFNLLLVGFFIIAFIIFVIGEFIGVFFVDDWLRIPADRISAAKIVYQASILTFLLHLLSVPYMSAIVANEKMKVFAYISIIDGILKLLLVFLIYYSSADRLVYYSILTLIVSVIVLSIYVIYCSKYLPYCKFHLWWDKQAFKELTAYTGWNMFGSITAILVTQGQNILLNIFFGPVINTAKAIADKIQSVINSFSTNFYMAVSPQIVKLYASGERQQMLNLATESSRLSFFLILILSFPLIVSMKPLLVLWLGVNKVSSIMIGFSKLALVYCLVSTLEQPITYVIRATGNIKMYQIKVGMCTLMYIPIAALVLYMGADAISTMIVLIILLLLVQVIRVYIAKKQVYLDMKNYMINVIKPIIIVSLTSAILFVGLDEIKCSSLIYEVSTKLITSLIGIIMIIWFIGLKSTDKKYIKNICMKFLSKRHIA